MIGFQPLLQRTTSSCLLFAILLTGMRNASAAPPQPDFPTLMAYQRALESSADPGTKTIVKQIMRGPVDLARERAAAQAEGIPLVSHLSPMPPSQNAAPLYLQWMTLSQKNPLNLPIYAETLNRRYAYTPEQLAQVQQILDSHSAEMRLMHQASDRPLFILPANTHFVLPPDKRLLESGLISLRSHVFIWGKLREVARELNTESFLLAKKGRYADAIRNQTRGFRVAQHATYATDDGTMIAHSESVFIQDITLSGMQNMLYIAGPNAYVDARVQNAISSNRPFPSLKVALSRGIIGSLSEMETVRRLSPAEVLTVLQEAMETNVNHIPAGDKSSSPEERHFINALFDAAEAKYIHEMRILIWAADRPAPVRHRVIASIPEADFAFSDVRTTNPIRALFAIFMEDSSRVYNTQAHEEVTLAGAAILVIRAHTGTFPKSLPPGFSDPFTDKPLGYHLEGSHGFVVYSVGADGKFEGGKPGDTEHGDHVLFRYPGPPPIPYPYKS